MLCEPSKDDIFEKLKFINKDEYEKAIIKKAVDLEFDVSYIPLVALTIALLGIVLTNFQRSEVTLELWIVIGTVIVFSMCTFFVMKSKKDKLMKLLDEEKKNVKK